MRDNMLIDTDAQHQKAASRQLLRAGHRQQQAANAVEDGGALCLEPLAGPVHQQLALLLHALGRHEAHVGATDRLADGGRHRPRRSCRPCRRGGRARRTWAPLGAPCGRDRPDTLRKNLATLGAHDCRPIITGSRHRKIPCKSRGELRYGWSDTARKSQKPCEPRRWSVARIWRT